MDKDDWSPRMEYCTAGIAVVKRSADYIGATRVRPRTPHPYYYYYYYYYSTTTTTTTTTTTSTTTTTNTTTTATATTVFWRLKEVVTGPRLLENFFQVLSITLFINNAQVLI